MRTESIFKGVGKVCAALGVAAALLASPALAQDAPVADASAAPAGEYALDTGHTSVLVRIPHQGFSYSVFRFTGVSGTLTWDPAAPENNLLSAVVEVGSMAAFSPEFAVELTDERFLNAAEFPQATFMSTAFRQIDEAHGQVDGVLTIRGVAQDVTFDVELIGAGASRGGAKLGVQATTSFDISGLGLPPFIRGPATMVIDSEFAAQSQ